jgi:FKBP-type peptidyl-prolyl cis-trans isomerase
MKRLGLLGVLAVFLVSVAYAGDSTQVKEDQTKKEEVKKEEVKKEAAKEATKEPEIITKESGVRYEDLKVGTGKVAVDSMKVLCDYTLWLADSTGLVKGEKIDSSKDRGQPFQCQLGVGLIPGWTDGMIGMKEGGSRRIFVPWKLGYPNGAGGRIPPKTNLIFEIDFIKALD